MVERLETYANILAVHAVVSLFRQSRACPGHPRLKKEVVDARHKAGHDDG
jgi:hypothetical protein